MPRGNRGRGRGRNGRAGRGRGGREPRPDNRVSFQDIPKQNEKMERYYNTLNIVPAGAERDAFWAAYKRELPNSFRFTGSKGDALALRDNFLSRHSPKLQEAVYLGIPVSPPVPVPWYPDQLAYSMTVPKNVVRKQPEFRDFQLFQVLETTVGNMNRQEVVSMIPPLFMDVEPEHSVLDMCAAPGSKTAQLIEMIHAGEEANVIQAVKSASAGENPGSSGQTSGLLIANDSNYQRAQMLVHQTKRLNSPNLIVTNHDATLFPSIALAPPDGNKPGKYLHFDRILADVPCSGDGTLRKNPNIWKDWTPQNGLGLYITQVRILVRALQLLKRGGRVVYSTCSMNPVENEAVIASAIERCGGVNHVELVDCSDKLGTLVRSPGLTDWLIMNRDGVIYESWEEAKGPENKSKIVPGMFPPDSEEEIRLERCMRLYPHQQDTGGFFVAVLQRSSDLLPVAPEETSKCVNKEWIFKKQGTVHSPKVPLPHERTPPADSITNLIKQVETESMDQNGHLHQKQGEVSAANERSTSLAHGQNDTSEQSSASKRKTIEHSAAEAPVIKKTKRGDHSEDVETSNGSVHERVSPAVAVGAEAASGFAENNSNAETAKSVQSRHKDVDKDTRIFRTNDVPRASVGKLGQGAKGGKNKEPEREHFVYLDPDHPDLLSIYDFYQLHQSFPREQFLVRNSSGDPRKAIYYTSKLAKIILLANKERSIKFVHAGVRMFMKQDVQKEKACCWRIQTEGLPIIEGWVGEHRAVTMHRKDSLRKLLKEMFIKLGKDEEEGQGWRSLPDIGEHVRDLTPGCYILRFQATKGDEGLSQPLTFPLWKGSHSINLMAPKEDRKALLFRIFGDKEELVNNSFPSRPNGKGSVSAQDAAEELQQRVEEDAEVDVEMEEDGGLDGAAAAMEEDAVAKRDHLEKEKLQDMELEDTKVTNAMPEREHEGDDYNTTV